MIPTSYARQLVTIRKTISLLASTITVIFDTIKYARWELVEQVRMAISMITPGRRSMNWIFVLLRLPFQGKEKRIRPSTKCAPRMTSRCFYQL